MEKLVRFGIIEAICAVNLVTLVYMLFATSYTSGFTEERAVVASFLWLFAVIPAIPMAIYGIVKANMGKKPKAKGKPRTTLLLICWLTVVANAVVVSSMFVR